MFAQSMDCKWRLICKDMKQLLGLLFQVEWLLSFQIGVGFLAQYLIKPMLGFLIVMVCLFDS